MATYKTGWLRLPSDPNNFKERFAWSHVKTIFYDKAKNILLKKKLDDMDELISAHADAIANKLMTNDAFNTVIADYVTKAMMSSVQVNDAAHVPTSSLAYAMQQAITANANAITQLNSDLKGLVTVKTFYSSTQTFESNACTDIPFSTPNGYKAVGYVGIRTNGFIGSAYAYVSDTSASVWLATGGGSGELEISILFIAK